MILMGRCLKWALRISQSKKPCFFFQCFTTPTLCVFVFPFGSEIPRYVCKTRARALHHRVPAYLGCLGSKSQRYRTATSNSKATRWPLLCTTIAVALPLRGRVVDVWQKTKMFGFFWPENWNLDDCCRDHLLSILVEKSSWPQWPWCL